MFDQPQQPFKGMPMMQPAKPKKRKKAQKKYATVFHPTMEAVVEELFYFADKQKAEARLSNIRDTFVGKKLPVGEDWPSDEYVLWIRGFGLSPEEEESGYRGHYARIHVAKGDDELWTLKAEKIDEPLHKHPQRKRPDHNHPDWNYPVMRGIKKERIYEDYDQALGELETLHIDFPDVTIPGKGKLHIIIYEGKEADNYTNKYLLQIKTIDDDGRCMIEYKLKDPAPKKTPALKQKRHEETEEVLGSFTQKLKGERFRKK
jgi:hypothetical protein